MDKVTTPFRVKIRDVELWNSACYKGKPRKIFTARIVEDDVQKSRSPGWRIISPPIKHVSQDGKTIHAGDTVYTIV